MRRAPSLGVHRGGYIAAMRGLARNRSRASSWLGVCAALTLAALLVPALAAASTTGATTPGTVLPTLTTPSTTTTTTPASTGPYTVANTTGSSSSGGLSGTDELAIIVVAILLIVGIWRLIVRDARSHTPAGAPPDPDRPRGSVRPIEHRVKRSRAKGKNARRARRSGR
jgi:hypothetical protein